MLNRKIGGIKGFGPEKAALTTLNWKNSKINGGEPEKWPPWQRRTGKIATLTAVNRKKRRYWRWTGEIAAVTVLNRKNSGVDSAEPEKRRPQQRWTGRKAALTALNWKNSGIHGGEMEKSGVNGVELEK